ncbi:MAG: hypothetical protein HUJ11_05880 [Arenibacter algicola]|nr:hypothetical protein [Arenibacter algicola]
MAGIAILVGGTVWEISMLCESLEDLNVLYTDFEIDDGSALTAMSAVCNPEIPTVSDLRDYVFGADLPEDPDA